MEVSGLFANVKHYIKSVVKVTSYAQQVCVVSRNLRFYSQSYALYCNVSRLFVKVMRLFAKSIFQGYKYELSEFLLYIFCIFFVKFKNQPHFTEKKNNKEYSLYINRSKSISPVHLNHALIILINVC